MRTKFFTTLLVILAMALSLSQMSVFAQEPEKGNSLIFLPLLADQQRTEMIVECIDCSWWNPWAEWTLKSREIDCDDTSIPNWLVWNHDESSSDVYGDNPNIFDEPFSFNQEGENCFLKTSIRYDFAINHTSINDDVSQGKLYFQF